MCDLFSDAEVIFYLTYILVTFKKIKKLKECALTGFCCPGAPLVLRGKIRGHYHIKASLKLYF
jgi:hypothetical protein